MDITTQLVRDIAVSRPGATAVFRRFKIDYCCGGGTPLAKAAETRGADLEALAKALAALTPGRAEAPQQTGALIEHLIERYHEVHRQQFPEAVRLARRVEAVHREHPAVPVGLSQHLVFMFEDLELHQQKEELMLFPMMSRGVVPQGPIACMEEEHEDVVVQLDTLARMTTDFTPPEGACTSWRALYELCREIDADLRDHVHIENDVLFRRFN